MAAAIGLITIGGILIASALKGVGITDLIAGAVGGQLNPAGGSKQFPDDTMVAGDPVTAPDGTKVDTGDILAGGTRAPGVGTFDGKPVANWIIPILKYARKHGWTGRVNSGYRTFAEQTAACATGVKPCATPGTSNHEGSTFPRGAVDVSNAAQLSAILLQSPYASTLVWAGAKDPVHFSHPHGGSY